MNNANDLLELEIAFQAFAQITIDLLIETKVTTPDAWSSQLLKVAAILRENESVQAANQLERLAVFAEQRASDQALRDLPNTASH